MGGRSRDQLGNGLPGPGTYEPTESMIKCKNPEYDFGRSPDRSRSGSPQKEGEPDPG